MFDAPAIELSSTPAVSRTGNGNGLPRGYVAVWAVMTGIAGLYITQISLESVNLPQLIANGAAPAAADPEASRAREAELVTLRHSLTEFQRDVSRVRVETETRKLDAGLVATLSALEERMSMTTGIAVAKVSQPAVPAAETPVASGQPLQTPAVSSAAALEAWTGKPAAAPAPEPRVMALAPPALDELTAPIETGSIAPPAPVAPAKMNGQLPKAAPAQLQAAVQPLTAPPPAGTQTAPAAASPISFGPALVKAEPKPFAVQLASGASVDDIRYSWSVLSQQNAENLGKLQPRYTSTVSDTAGPTYDLIAGPVKTAADAKRICKSLAARGIDCKVTPYGGEAF